MKIGLAFEVEKLQKKLTERLYEQLKKKSHKWLKPFDGKEVMLRSNKDNKRQSGFQPEMKEYRGKLTVDKYGVFVGSDYFDFSNIIYIETIE
ncbi:MAG: hypothetical protein PHE59_02680 [Patescibacteria group bacterium]|nr:hypothetical protein [Patescibacteria group bacterium]MDD5164389.1 hypothetical protein [Patescibacteria group bacterium]MDD5534959.1 hypothetical protein [Patescibacteria group bacterium]